MKTKFPVIFGLAFLTLLIPSQAFAEFDVSLPPPLAVVEDGFEPITLPRDPTTFVEATGINCKVKQTTQVFNQQGRLVDEIDSAGVQGSPFAQLQFTFTLMDEDIHHFSIIPKIFCSENSGLPVEAWIKQMTISTVAEFEGSRQIVDTINISQSPLAQFGAGQGEQNLANRAITSIDLEEHLPDENLGVNWIFQITGTVNVAYSNFPQIVYQIPILWNELDTLVPTNVLKATEPPPVDSDGDGIIDSLDACPNEAENFNGFEDTDGCFDIPIITCPEGQLVVGNTCVIEPVDVVMPLNCESGDLSQIDEIACMNECLLDGNEWRIDPNTGKGFCQESTTTTTTTGEAMLSPDEILTGQVQGLGRVVFNDLTEDTFLIGESGFGFGVGTIQPLSVTVPIAGQEKEIERIEFELHYRFPNTADGTATFLDDQDILFTPSVIVAGSQESGQPRLGTSPDLGQNAELRSGVGLSLLLSKGTFLDKDIQVLATQEDPVTGASPPIPEGQARQVTFRIDANGDFTLERDSTLQDARISNAFATFGGITINNEVGIDRPIGCPSGTRQTFDVDGQQTGCEPIPTDPDTDNDGVPDNEDLCPNEAGVIENGGCPAEFCTAIASCVEGASFNENTCRCESICASNEVFNTITNSCEIPQEPTNGDVPCERGGTPTVIGQTIICVKGGDGGIIFGGNTGDGLDLNTLLIFGGIGLIIIGIIVVIARRR